MSYTVTTVNTGLAQGRNSAFVYVRLVDRKQRARSVDELSVPLRQRLAVLTASPDERKRVTILFADIVGSTGLAENLDPEEWRHIVSGVHTHISQVVDHYEGTIAQFLGDGVSGILRCSIGA